MLYIQYLTLDNGQKTRPKHVDFYSKNKFEKLVHFLGFIIGKYHAARSSECQISRCTVIWMSNITLHGHLNVKYHAARSPECQIHATRVPLRKAQLLPVKALLITTHNHLPPRWFNPLNAELNSIWFLLALLAHHFLHVSRIRVKSLTLIYIYIYIYIYEAPILDVSRSHTTTHHSR